MEKRPKVGLALGSGGGRGLAHIGVLQVLEENHIPIDMISGCSIGSLVAVIYAAGTNLSLLERYVYTMIPKDIIDPTITGRGGVLSGEKLESIVRVLSHDLDIGQTRIPCYITAADLASGRQKVFTEGKLYKAARASMAIPGIFTPVNVDGCWYVDGGTLEEMPVTVLRDNGADMVIAVDLTIRKNPVDAKLTAHGSLLRAFEIMQMEMTRLRNQNIDVRIQPDVSFMGMVSTAGAEQAVAEGRRAAEQALPLIREKLTAYQADALPEADEA